MNPIVIDVRSAQDARDVVHRAVQALAEGKLVAFPTETVYGLAASALQEEAVARLLQVKSRRQGHPLPLAVKSAEEALDYVPAADGMSRRLARRCWPGPITLVLHDDHPESLLRQLPESVRTAVVPTGTVGLRVPGHQLILDVLRLIPGPLTLTSANRTGQADPVTGGEVVESLGVDVDLILDDGRTQFAQPSSVVKVENGRTEMLREGVVSSANLARLASPMVLFVCTGNTCRSPMAELLCRQRLAEKLKCSIDQLDDRGPMVLSAGIAAPAGQGPSHEAVEVMADRGLDLSRHVTQPLSDRLVRHADLVLTMTQGHRDAIVGHWPEAAERTLVLCADGVDVTDPIGGPKELYARCAEQIAAAIAQRLEEFDLTC